MIDTILFNRIFSTTLDTLAKAKKNFCAEDASSYSDSLFWKIHPESLKDARGCQLSIVVSSFIGITDFNLELLYKQIFVIGDKFNWQGPWEFVFKQLQTPPVPYLQLQILLQTMQTEEFFGNWLPRMIRILRGFKVINPYISKPKKVKYPKRKRGYDDKGHLPDRSKPGAIAVPERKKKHLLDEIYQFTEYNWYPSWYVEKNNNLQRTLVEENTPITSSDSFGLNDLVFAPEDSTFKSRTVSQDELNSLKEFKRLQETNPKLTYDEFEKQYQS